MSVERPNIGPAARLTVASSTSPDRAASVRPPELVRHGGRPVLRLTSIDPLGRLALLRHRAILEAGLPGAPRCLGHTGDELLMTWHGSHTLATRAPSDPGAIAAVAAGVATTLADLHALGFVHDRVRAEHVVIDGEGRATLVGLGGVRLASAGPGDDVRQLAALIVAVVDEQLMTDAPGRRRRSFLAERRSRAVARGLLDLAARILADGRPGPPARRVAHELHALVSSSPSRRRSTPRPHAEGPAATTPSAPGDGDGDDGELGFEVDGVVEPDDVVVRDDVVEVGGRNRRLSLAGSVAAIVAFVVTVALGFVLAQVVLRGPGATARPPGSDRGTSPSDVHEALAASSPSTPPATALPVVITTVAPDGAALIDGRRVALGQAGDEVALADLTCAGTPDLVLLRPSTGELFQLPDWRPEAPARQAGVAAVVTPGSHLRAAPMGATCTPLVVVTPDGHALPVQPLGGRR